MCVQCMMGAMAAGARASGARAGLARWLTPAVLRRVTIVLVVAALGVSSMISGSSAHTAHAGPAAVHANR